MSVVGDKICTEVKKKKPYDTRTRGQGRTWGFAFRAPISE